MGGQRKSLGTQATISLLLGQFHRWSTGVRIRRLRIANHVQYLSQFCPCLYLCNSPMYQMEFNLFLFQEDEKLVPSTARPEVLFSSFPRVSFSCRYQNTALLLTSTSAILFSQECCTWTRYVREVNSSLFGAAASRDLHVSKSQNGGKDEDLRSGRGKKVGVNSIWGTRCPDILNCRLFTEVAAIRIPTLPQNNTCRYLMCWICFSITSQ